MSSEPETTTSEATPATPVTTEPQPSQRLVVAAVACVAVVGLVFLGSVGVYALRHLRPHKADTTVAMAAKAVDDEPSLVSETQTQDGRDPFLAQGIAATADTAIPVPPKDPTGPAPVVIPTPSVDPPKTNPTPAADPPKPTPSTETSKPAAPSKPEKPKAPSRAELATLDPASPPDWVTGPGAAEGLVLMGLVASGKPQAVFEYEGKVVRRRIGEEVAGMTVSRIERGQVMLRDANSGGPVKAFWLTVREGNRLGGTRSGPVKTVTPPADSTSESSGSGSSGSESSGDTSGEGSSGGE
ncbi:MAG: hypothetical protein HZB16_24220 [Armatimonadetes bacterium]|nr:hypothetical protein [Armatimonadota bacterium]